MHGNVLEYLKSPPKIKCIVWFNADWLALKKSVIKRDSTCINLLFCKVANN